MQGSDRNSGNSIVLFHQGQDDYYNTGFREITSFNGTLLDNKSNKLAKLHNKITASETGYSRKRRYLELAGNLSQWFDTAVLDQISLILEKKGDSRESSFEEEVKKYLAFIDCFLRLEGNILRWKTLIDINEYFKLKITRKSLFKYRVEAHRMLFNRYGRKNVLEKLARSPIMAMRRIASEFITSDSDLSGEEKALVREGTFHIIKSIRDNRFIPRDIEIYAFSAYYIAKKGLTCDPGKYNFPVDDPKFRRSISNAIYNIKTKVIGKDPVETLLNEDDQNKTTTVLN